MAGPRKPALYRIARGISILATIVTVVLLVYVAATVYSATRARPELTNNNSIAQTMVPGGVKLGVTLNFSNPGFFPINGIQLAAIVNAPDNASRIATGSSPVVAVPAASTVAVPLQVTIELANNPAVVPLLTHNAQLPAEIWANITVSSLFSLNVNVSTNISWGAPFDHLNLTPGTPSSSNGSVTVPFTLAFDNNARFALAGTLNLAAQGSGGCSATLPAVPLNVPSGGSFSQVVPVTVSSGCAGATWSTVTGSYSSSDWNVTLPSEPIP